MKKVRNHSFVEWKRKTFFKWMRENGHLKEWLINMNSIGHDRLTDFLQRERSDFISAGFFWNKSEQGWNFWNGVHMEWNEYLVNERNRLYGR